MKKYEILNDGLKQEGLQSEPPVHYILFFPSQAFWQISQYEHVERFF